MKHWILAGLLLPAFFACGRPIAPATVETDGAIAPITVAATGSRAYRSNWDAVPQGELPSEYMDVQDEGHRHSWLYDGGWRVSHASGQAVLEVPYALTNPREPLTFRRWVGGTFGGRGALPLRYRVNVEARSLGGSKRFNGYGEVATQVVYHSPTTYVEVLHTGQALYIWEANDAPPMQGRGWRQLARVPHNAPVGTWVRFGAEVNRTEGTIAAYLNGQQVAKAKSSLIGAGRPNGLTIRATGNKEEWRSVEIVELN